ncbi:hypothetical protein KHQ88_00145 [Mycoplasmatota bacterium]|nr:hypothetical protein KHQ88_00145 [Mycoplasmatota bacterium]
MKYKDEQYKKSIYVNGLCQNEYWGQFYEKADKKRKLFYKENNYIKSSEK